ncbi:MAG: ATP-binding protein, partial [Desulfobulbaceae bacterium]|nr:ATP-binding protein [Desulfobulbaceae bacterium]
VQALRLENERYREKAKRADDANKAKSDFLTIISHEIRTPMNGVIGISELLLKSDLAPKQQRFAELIHSSAQNLLTLIDSLLDFSKIEAEKMSLDPAPFDIFQLADELISLYKAAGERKSLDFLLDIDPGIKRYYLADGYRIRQVLVNLLGNALKFTEGGSVALRLSLVDSSDEADVLYFAVKDSGPGIPRSKQHLLFVPFAQLDSSTTRRFGGTGLGLSICSKLIELMEGEIGVFSEEGEGSTFWFTVPLSHVECQEKEDVARLKSAVSGKSSSQTKRPRSEEEIPRILIVEDDPTNRMVIEEIFKDIGLMIRSASHGKEACELCEKENFDLIFMDCQMPIMDGFEATATILQRAGHHGELPPVIIALTADATPFTRQRCKDVGMEDYLLKPIDFISLRKVMESWFPAVARRLQKRLVNKEEQKEASGLIDLAEAEHITPSTIARLKENVGDIRPVIKVFLGSLPARLQQLERAMLNNDFESLRLVAHTLKGSCSQFGAVRMAALCYRIEQQGLTGNFAGIEQLFKELRIAATELEEFLLEELDQICLIRDNKNEYQVRPIG